MNSRPTVRRVRGERGSALLIVLVFSAIILILLYREIPVATFEAARAKEQTAIDRGHEYQRAVQLFYRRNGRQYPASIDQLESTNGVRFLRRRYKDPFTGKDDWRLVHAGPGGMLIDSKVAPTGLTGASGTTANGQGTTGTTASTGSTSGFGSSSSSFGSSSSSFGSASSSSSFGSSSSSSLFGSSSNSSNDSTDTASGDQQNQPRRHSPPAIAAGASGDASGNGSADPNAGGIPTTADLNADPSKPLLPSTADASAGANGAGGAQQPGQQGSSAGNGTGAPSSGKSAMNAVTSNNANGLGAMNRSLTGNAGSTGGIAGVGFPNEVKGRSIKTVNEQQQYAKWEFYYDPSKDTGTGCQNGTQNNAGQTVPGLNNTQGSGTGIQIGGSSLGNNSDQQNGSPSQGTTGGQGTGVTPPQGGSQAPQSQ